MAGFIHIAWFKDIKTHFLLIITKTIFYNTYNNIDGSHFCSVTMSAASNTISHGHGSDVRQVGNVNQATDVSETGRKSNRDQSDRTVNDTTPVTGSSRSSTKTKPLLKIAIANFCGVRQKSANLTTFCADTIPDVLIGSESWLDGSGYHFFH